MDEDGATQAPSASLTRALKGAVLGDDHHVSSHTTITGLLCRQSKVEAVASVVFHNEKDTRRSYLGRKVICERALSLMVQSVSLLYICNIHCSKKIRRLHKHIRSKQGEKLS